MTITAHDTYLHEDNQPVPINGARSWQFGPFKDEDDQTVIPTAIAYTLTDRDGTALNEKEDIAVTPASTVTITLNNADTALQSGETEELVERRLLLEWTYDSDLGTDLLGKTVMVFWLRDFYPDA